MIKDIWEKNLFFLQSRTMVGGVVVASHISWWQLKVIVHEVGTWWSRCFTNFGKPRSVERNKDRKIIMYEYYIIEKQSSVKFGTTIHQTKAILYYMHKSTWGLIKTASFEFKLVYSLHGWLLVKSLGIPSTIGAMSQISLVGPSVSPKNK